MEASQLSQSILPELNLSQNRFIGTVRSTHIFAWVMSIVDKVVGQRHCMGGQFPQQYCKIVSARLHLLLCIAIGILHLTARVFPILVIQRHDVSRWFSGWRMPKQHRIDCITKVLAKNLTAVIDAETLCLNEECAQLFENI